MSQTKLGSFIEAMVNILIGFSINFVANLIILPIVGLPVTIVQNLWIGFFFTFISVFRTYVIRRWFNRRLVRRAA